MGSLSRMGLAAVLSWLPAMVAAGAGEDQLSADQAAFLKRHAVGEACDTVSIARKLESTVSLQVQRLSSVTTRSDAELWVAKGRESDFSGAVSLGNLASSKSSAFATVVVLPLAFPSEAGTRRHPLVLWVWTHPKGDWLRYYAISHWRYTVELPYSQKRAHAVLYDHRGRGDLLLRLRAVRGRRRGGPLLDAAPRTAWTGRPGTSSASGRRAARRGSPCA